LNPADKSIAVKQLQFDSPQIKIYKANVSTTTKQGKTSITGQVDGEYDWPAVGPVVGSSWPAGLELKGKTKNTIKFSSKYRAGQRDKILPNLYLTTKPKLAFDGAEYKGLRFGKTQVPINVKDGLLRIEQFSTSVNGGKFAFAGNINFKQDPAFLKASGPMQMIENANMNPVVCEQLLKYLNPVFVDQTDVSGVSNFHCEKLSIPLKKGLKDALEITGTIGINNMRLKTAGLLGLIMSRANVRQSVNLTLVPTRFELQKDVLSYRDMQINVDEYPVNFSGSIGPEIRLPGATKPDKKLDMMVITPYVVTFLPEPRFETVKVGEVTDKKRIPVPLGGTLTAPTFRLEKVLGDVLKQGLEELLKQQLEEQIREKIFEGIEELLK